MRSRSINPLTVYRRIELFLAHSWTTDQMYRCEATDARSDGTMRALKEQEQESKGLTRTYQFSGNQTRKPEGRKERKKEISLSCGTRNMNTTGHERKEKPDRTKSGDGRSTQGLKKKKINAPAAQSHSIPVIITTISKSDHYIVLECPFSPAI